MFWDVVNFLTDHSNDPMVLAIVFVANLTLLSGRYLVLNGAIILLTQKFGSFFERYRIQASEPDRHQMLEEIKDGLRANFVFALIGTWTHYLVFSQSTKIYFHSWNERGVQYYLFSIVLVLVIYDAYFYFAHRILHDNKWLYAKVHSLHHKYRNPTAYADLALHPLEALIFVAIIPAITLLIPIHYSVLGALYGMLVLGNIMGHMGFEFVPKRLARAWLGKSLTFMSFHNFHHSHIKGNYGFALRTWDKVFGTEVKAYEEWLQETSVVKDLDEEERIAS